MQTTSDLWVKMHIDFISCCFACAKKNFSRASNSAQNLLVSWRKDVPERHFETVLRQFLQFSLPKLIHNRCSAYEICFFELQILRKSTWFLEGMAQPNVTLRLLWKNFLNSLFQKSFAIDVLHASVCLCTKPVGFPRAWHTRTSLWDCFKRTSWIRLLFQNSFTIEVLHANFGFSNFKFYAKTARFLRT